MQPHQQRVVTERDELAEKASKLEKFFHGDTFKALPEAEQERLDRQFKIMADYLKVLDERIAAF